MKVSLKDGSNDKHRIFGKRIFPCVWMLSLFLLLSGCQKQTGEKQTEETQAEDVISETDPMYDDTKCILISEETTELTFDEVVEQKQKRFHESENQIAARLSEKENQIRRELDEQGKNGQDAVIQYFFTNGTFAYSGNEDYQIGLSALIAAVEVPNEEKYIHSVDEVYSTLVSGKHHAVWNEAASAGTISIYQDTVRLAAAGFFDIYEDHSFDEPGFSLCESEPNVTLTSETLNPVLVFELPK